MKKTLYRKEKHDENLKKSSKKIAKEAKVKNRNTKHPQNHQLKFKKQENGFNPISNGVNNGQGNDFSKSSIGDIRASSIQIQNQGLIETMKKDPSQTTWEKKPLSEDRKVVKSPSNFVYQVFGTKLHQKIKDGEYDDFVPFENREVLRKELSEGIYKVGISKFKQIFLGSQGSKEDDHYKLILQNIIKHVIEKEEWKNWFKRSDYMKYYNRIGKQLLKDLNSENPKERSLQHISNEYLCKAAEKL